jgi:hypothetical protein
MTSYYAELAQNKSLCAPARTFAQIAAQSIFAKITDRFHYPSGRGMHACVRDVYTEAAYRLQNLSIMQPVPEAPAAKQQVITVEGVVVEIEEKLSTSTTETDLGTKE